MKDGDYDRGCFGQGDERNVLDLGYSGRPGFPKSQRIRRSPVCTALQVPLCCGFISQYFHMRLRSRVCVCVLFAA